VRVISRQLTEKPSSVDDSLKYPLEVLSGEIYWIHLLSGGRYGGGDIYPALLFGKLNKIEVPLDLLNCFCLVGAKGSEWEMGKVLPSMAALYRLKGLWIPGFKEKHTLKKNLLLFH